MILDLLDRRRDRTVTAVNAMLVPWAQYSALAGAVGCSRWRANLVLVDDDAMAALNGDYRGLCEPTDVLSFSYLATEGSGRPDLVAGDRGARCDLWLDKVAGSGDDAPLVGEIVIALGFVVDRCAERGWRPDWEIPLLAVHGCLHILGWEHDIDADREAMKACEAAILQGCGLPHPLAPGA